MTRCMPDARPVSVVRNVAAAPCCECEHTDHDRRPATLPASFPDWRRSPWHAYGVAVLTDELRALVIWPGMWSGVCCRACLVAGHIIGYQP